MKKPRKKKIPEIKKIWDLPIEEIMNVITQLEDKYPDSGQLVSYKKEVTRRERGDAVEEAGD